MGVFDDDETDVRCSDRDEEVVVPARGDFLTVFQSVSQKRSLSD